MPRKIYFHDHCPDGLTSAAIMRLAYPSAELVPAQYGQDYQFNDGDFAVDWCPKEPDAKLIVLDHHPTAQAVIQGCHPASRYRNGPGVCGATIAADWIAEQAWPVLESRPFWADVVRARGAANLAAIRDTWQRASEDWDRACAQASWMMLNYPDVASLPSDEQMDIGHLLYRQRARQAQEYAKEAVLMAPDVYFISCPADMVSDVAEAHHAFGSVKLFATVQILPVLSTAYRYSLRGPADRPLGIFAKRYGGGGHAAAAGFTSSLQPLDIASLLCVYLSSEEDP